MSKRRILVFIFLVLLEIFYSSVYISEHKRPLEILEFQKDGKPIEDADEIPQEAKALNINKGYPLLRIKSTIHDVENTITNLCQQLCIGDKFTFIV